MVGYICCGLGPLGVGVSKVCVAPLVCAAGVDQQTHRVGVVRELGEIHADTPEAAAVVARIDQVGGNGELIISILQQNVLCPGMGSLHY